MSILLDPKSGRALAPGGKCFAEPVEVTVSGSTFGDCLLKVGWQGWTVAELIDCKQNIRYAKELFDDQGFSPWVAYWNGAYKEFLK